MPALLVKLFGALVLGFIYQFYYSGGDTFNFHTIGSRVVYNALVEKPDVGIALFFADSKIYPEGSYEYASKIYFFGDPSSYMVIRIATFFDLFTFSSYSATALCFAAFSFCGMWMLYMTFYKHYPSLHLWLAIACFFIPSVFFWGSGLLKDTLIMGALGILTYEVDRLFFRGKISVLHLVIMIISLVLIFTIKKFILQAFVPAILVWIYLHYSSRIRSIVLKMMVIPVVFVLIGFTSYYAVERIGAGDSRYSINRIGYTARETAHDILYYSGRDAGSGYYIGELDGTIRSMIALAPQAINVTLFRPYLWEVNNPLMLMAALESLLFLILVGFILYKRRWSILKHLSNPDVNFCLIFTLIYAAAVGVSTFNFGTLVRYKIPLMPFFAIALIIFYYGNREENRSELETTE